MRSIIPSKRIVEVKLIVVSESAFGALLSPPICGWLIAAYGFRSAQIFSGAMLAIGTGFIVSDIPISDVVALLQNLPHYQISRRLSQIVTRSYLAKTSGKLIL